MVITKKLCQVYVMEAAGLGGFVVIAGLLSILLDHPDLAVMRSFLKDHALLRRVPMGIVLGIYIFVITLLFGKKSGAQINPAVTWSFYRLGKINFTNAVMYTIFQFAGAIAGAQLLKYFAGGLFSHPLIDYGVAKPKPEYSSMAAFAAEFIISFILMIVILFTSSSRCFERFVALISGLLIAVYIIFEMPFSGMSLNPARSFSGALAAHEWDHLWIYFIAPPLAMLIASEIFHHWKKKKISGEDKDYKEIPIYPVQQNNN